MRALALAGARVAVVSVCCVSAVVWIAAVSVSAAEFQPQLDQPGKDVVWVPTPEALAARMLDLARLTAKDYLIDLGSGDGRLVIMAAKRGARAHGIEYSTELVEYARRNAAQSGLAARATFAQGDLFASDFSQATVITLFLGPDLNRKLLPKLLALRPGTRIVSNTHSVGDWPADEIAESTDDVKAVYYRKALLWMVPARVAGDWQSSQGRLTLTQRYQTIAGTLMINGSPALISDAVLRGDQIRFTAGGISFTGQVTADAITGVAVEGGVSRPWRAARIRKSAKP